MQDILTRFPKIDAVFASDDPMALGALESSRRRGARDQVFGVNGKRKPMPR